MSPTEQVVSDFLARMQSDDPAAGWTSSNVQLGKKYLFSHASAPRIVIVPEGGRLTADRVRPGGNPRMLLVREVTLRFFCFAKTLELTETVLHNAIRAIRNTVHAAFEPLEEWWPSEDLGSRDIDSPCIGFSISVHLPVYDATIPVVEPPLTETFTVTVNNEQIPLTDP